MVWFLVFLYIIYTIYKIFLSNLELNFVREKMNEKAVVLSEEDYKQAAKTAIINQKFSIFSDFYGLVVAVFWIVFGASFLQNFIYESGVFKNEIFKATALVVAFLIINSLLSLPLDIYSSFVKDKKLGFSNMTPKIFIIDTLKSLFLMLIFGSLFICALIFCIQNLGNFWWIWAFLFSFCVILLINLIYPTIIAPMFNKMSPLQDGELKEQICELLQKCGFKSSGVFVMDASKRDKRLNAYFGGFGATKKVVLFDTLIEKLTQNEILAVLGHELGHFKHGDILKNIALSFVLLGVIFAVFGNLPNSVFSALNLKFDGGAILVFMILFLPILQAFLEPLVSKFSRTHEFGADEFASSVQGKDDMISALKKLGSENKAFPISHKIYSAVYHSHPSLYERIEELK